MICSGRREYKSENVISPCEDLFLPPVARNVATLKTHLPAITQSKRVCLFKVGSSPHFEEDTTMRFYFLRRSPGLLLLLVALTCAVPNNGRDGGDGRREGRFFLDDIGNTLNGIGETIKDTLRTGYDSVFGCNAEPETTTVTLELEPDGTTTPDYRKIINVPLRCPPNHVLVNNRCRLSARRR